MTGTANIARLLEVMARLRDKKTGCPWDLEQDFVSVAPFTLEETYELVEAIESNDIEHIKEELGDVLFQIVFHAQMGKEAGLFDFDSLAGEAADKMIERHPHVFADRDAKSSSTVIANWEKDKQAKREQKAKEEGRDLGVLDGISTALPASTRALKLQKRAARVGFDWADAKDVIAKIREEISELETEMTSPHRDKDAIEDEMGDVFFAIANLARKLGIDPETALRRTNRKFERRFSEVEKRLKAQGKEPNQSTLEEMESLWNQIKREEKTVPKDKRKASS